MPNSLCNLAAMICEALFDNLLDRLTAVYNCELSWLMFRQVSGPRDIVYLAVGIRTCSIILILRPGVPIA